MAAGHDVLEAGKAIASLLEIEAEIVDRAAQVVFGKDLGKGAGARQRAGRGGAGERTGVQQSKRSLPQCTERPVAV